MHNTEKLMYCNFDQQPLLSAPPNYTQADTQTQSHSKRPLSFGHTVQTGLINEQHQTPAAVCCSSHPVYQNYPPKTTAHKRLTRKRLRHNKQGVGAKKLTSARRDNSV